MLSTSRITSRLGLPGGVAAATGAGAAGEAAGCGATGDVNAVADGPDFSLLPALNRQRIATINNRLTTPTKIVRLRVMAVTG